MARIPEHLLPKWVGKKIHCALPQLQGAWVLESYDGCVAVLQKRSGDRFQNATFASNIEYHPKVLKSAKKRFEKLLTV